MTLPKLRRLLLIATVCLFVLPGFAAAHTGMESSSPAKDQIVEQEVGEITLSFNTEIESLSSFAVTDGQGNRHEVDNVATDDSQMSGTIDPALTNGQYTVEWKIIGRDGHAVTGAYEFQVRLPETASSPAGESSASAAAASEPAVESAEPSPTIVQSQEPIPQAMDGTASAAAIPSAEATLSAATPSGSEGSSADGNNNEVLIYALLAGVAIAVVVSVRKRRK